MYDLNLPDTVGRIHKAREIMINSRAQEKAQAQLNAWYLAMRSGRPLQKANPLKGLIADSLAILRVSLSRIASVDHQ